VTDVRRCLTWCNGFDKKQKDCASAARNRLSCSALDQCQLPALPPAPPPLTACLTICNHLVDDCKLLPSSQRLPCMGGCQNLSDSKKQCALKAKKRQPVPRHDDVHVLMRTSDNSLFNETVSLKKLSL
jgi:hypothetical protein